MFKSIKSYTLTDALMLLILITLPLPEHWNSKALLLALLFVLYSFYKKFEIRFHPIGWLYILLFVFASVSFLWSMEKPETLKALVRLWPVILFTLGHKQIFKFKSLTTILRISALVFLFYGIVWLILAFSRYLQFHASDTFFYHQLTAPFSANAIYIAFLFGQLYIFFLYYLLFSSTKNKTIDYFLTFYLFAFQFLLSSKMILSVLTLISLILFLLYLRKTRVKKRILQIGFLVSLSMIILFGLTSYTKNRFKDIIDYKPIENVFSNDYFGPGYYWNGLTLRLFQLRCFYEIQKEPNFNNLLGTGFHASQSTLNQKYAHYNLYHGSDREDNNDGYFSYNFHNEYAQLVIEIGFFGIIIILLMLYFFILYPLYFCIFKYWLILYENSLFKLFATFYNYF